MKAFYLLMSAYALMMASNALAGGLPSCAQEHLGVFETTYYDFPVNQFMKTFFDPSRNTLTIWDERERNNSIDIDFENQRVSVFQFIHYWAAPSLVVSASCASAPEDCLGIINGGHIMDGKIGFPSLITALESGQHTMIASGDPSKDQATQAHLKCAEAGLQDFAQQVREQYVLKRNAR